MSTLEQIMYRVTVKASTDEITVEYREVQPGNAAVKSDFFTVEIRSSDPDDDDSLMTPAGAARVEQGIIDLLQWWLKVAPRPMPDPTEIQLLEGAGHD